MKISQIMNHGKPRWRVNIQRGNYRKRLFFGSREEAVAFAEAATGATLRMSSRQPQTETYQWKP
jgi:hypothetical protein